MSYIGLKLVLWSFPHLCPGWQCAICRWVLMHPQKEN